MSFGGLVLNSVTRQQLESLGGDLPGSLLLTGLSGVGLGTIAEAIARGAAHGAAIQRVSDEKGAITIAVIRELYVLTRSKMDQKRVFILDNADTMGNDAQNAFLKLLEEPNDMIHFILTAHDKSALLPTVLSRVQTVEVKNITSSESKALLASQATLAPEKVAQLLFIASGLPAELMRLVHDEALQRRRIDSAQKAKQFLMGNQFERLVIVSSISSKDSALDVIDMSLRMLKVQLSQQQAVLTLQRIDALLMAREKIVANGNVRTQLLRIASV